MLRARRHAGFSIIELMIAITIAGVLIALGLPSLGGYIQTARLGSFAKSFYTGAQLARTEAIRLNLPVDFVLTNTPIAAGIETAAVASTTGRNWLVRYTDPLGVVQLVEAKAILDNGGASPAMTTLATNGTVTFNSLGASSLGLTSIDIANPAAGLCDPAGSVRCWRVAVSPGGQIRMCNPSSASATDTRAC